MACDVCQQRATGICRCGLVTSRGLAGGRPAAASAPPRRASPIRPLELSSDPRIQATRASRDPRIIPIDPRGESAPPIWRTPATRAVGLNFVNQGTSPKYGARFAALDDAVALGASILRQVPGAEVLRLGEPKLPVPVPVGYTTLRRTYLTSERVAKTLTFFRELEARGLKVILTFPDYGVGNTVTLPLLGSASCGAPARGEEGKGTLRDALEFRWAGRHAGATVTDVDGTIHDFGATGSSCWRFEALDVSSRYNRVYLGWFGELIGELLLEVAKEFGDLSRVLYAVELFNEVTLRGEYTGGSNPVADAGLAWGRAWFRLAYELRKQLDTSADATGVRILLPGVASYATAAGWERTLAFHEWFAQGALREATEIYRLDTETFVELFPTIAQGIDYHWYHVTGMSPRHVVHLPFEIDDLRDAIVAAAAAIEPRLASLDLDVSIFETGAPDEGDERQAHEIWRCMGGALASSAWLAGWHCWMTTPSFGFANFGLRDDSASQSAGDASAAVPRPSWFAYQQLATRLAPYVRSGRVALPAVSSWADADMEMLTLLRSWSGDPEVVVFEYSLSGEPGGATHAYLIVYDETYTRLAATAMWAVGTTSGMNQIWKVPTLPESFEVGTSASSDLPPIVNVEWAADLDTRWLRYRPERTPVLLLCTRAITWSYEQGVELVPDEHRVYVEPPFGA